jgi:hypothetical protein
MIIIRKSQVFAKERLYTDARGTKVLKEGDPDAAILLAAKGNEIPPKLVEKFGLLKEEPASPPAGTESISTRKTRVPATLKERA